jgi:hypothetical protein
MMTREEAHAQAERDVVAYARGGNMARAIAKVDGPQREPFYEVAGVLIVAAEGIVAELRTGRIDTAHIEALGALCIEFLRECHLKYLNETKAADA